MRRRQVLASLGASASLALGGCLALKSLGGVDLREIAVALGPVRGFDNDETGVDLDEDVDV